MIKHLIASLLIFCLAFAPMAQAYSPYLHHSFVASTSALYTQHRDPGHSYLIETDHRFTDYKSYTSSDYLLSRLSMDPSMAQKRLGDGFYEQKLISDQITQLTGRRFVGQYTSTEDQTRALMDSSVGAAQQLKLSTGIALSKEQAAALTQDIVWMVEEQITLADGTSTTALVPRVYLSAQHTIDLSPDGAVIAAEVIDIRSEGSLSNTGAIKSTRASMIAAQDILNKGSISSTGDLLLTASRDISNISGSISGRRVALSAGNNLLNSTASLSIGTRATGPEQNSSTGANGLGSFIPVDTGQASAYNTLIGNIGSISASDTLSLEAGNTLSILGASLSSGGNAQLKAGNQLIVNTLTTQSGITSGGPYKNDSAQTQNIRSSISAGNNLSLNSGGDMQLTAANLSAGRSASLISGGSLTLDTAKDITSHNQSAGRNINQAYDETVLGTNLKAGGNITLAATNAAPVGVASATNRSATAEKGNINLMSANLTSDTGKLTIIADNTLNIGTTAEKHTSLIQTYSESSGFMSSSSSTNRTETWRTNQIGSSLAANSISFSSGQDINITGSDITAINDATLIAGRDLNIFAATNTYGSESYSHTTSSGLQINGFNISDKGPEITTQQRTDATQQSFSRSNLTAKNGNLNLVAGNNLIVGGSDLAANAGNLNLIASGTVALLTGQDTLTQSNRTEIQSSVNFYTQQTRTLTDNRSRLDNQGSTAQGKAINIISSNADIILQAAKLNAGDGGITLNAGRDIQLLTAGDSASSSYQETLKTSGLDGNYDSTRNKDNKYDKQTQTAQVTSLVSDGNITTHSGRDTRIEASILNAAGAIDLSAGSDTQTGNLTFAAAKDKTFTAVSESSSNLVWQSSSGRGDSRETLKLANISAGKGLTVNASGNINVEIPEVPAEAKQTGLASAVQPADNSQAAANKTLNDEQRLTDHIQTLAQKPGQAWIGQLASLAQTQPDKIKLQQVNAAFKQWSYSNEGLTQEGAIIVALVVTYFTGGAASGAANTMVGTAAATTAAGAAASAALAAGMTTLATQATLAMINNQGDVGKTLNDLGKSENVKALVAAMLTAGATSGMTNALDMQNINAKNGLTANLGKNLVTQGTTAAVDTALNGGNLADKLQTAAKNAVIDTAAASAANSIGDLKQQPDGISNTTHKLAHATLGCALGEAKGGDCASGAVGAVVGEVTAEITTDNTGQALTTKQQTDTLNLSKLAAGTAVLVTGGDAQDINTAAMTAGNAVTNNYLNHAEIDALSKKLQGCGNDQACKDNAVADAAALSKKNDLALQATCKDNPTSSACQGQIQEALNYAGDKNETSSISKDMVTDLNRSRVVVLDQTLNGGSYSAVNNVETRADFFGAMGQQTGARWFNVAESTSRNELMGVTEGNLFNMGNVRFTGGDAYNSGNVSAWRNAAGNQIMANGLSSFQSIYNNPTQTTPYRWSINQLKNEQNDPKLQEIHQQYIGNFRPLSKPLMEIIGNVNDMLNPQDRISAGCLRMGYVANCGSAQ